jgi:hypothetical protein
MIGNGGFLDRSVPFSRSVQSGIWLPNDPFIAMKDGYFGREQFYEHFDEAAMNMARWETVSSAIAIANSEMVFGNGAEVGKSCTSVELDLTGNAFTVETLGELRPDTGSGTTMPIAIMNSADTKLRIESIGGTDGNQFHFKGSTGDIDLGSTAYITTVVKIVVNGTSAELFIDGVSKGSITHGITFGTGCHIWLQIRAGYQKYQYIRVYRNT